MGFNLVLFWIIIAVLAIIIEIITPAFFAIWFAGGAIVALILYYLDANIYFQIGGFVISSGILILFSEKILKKKIFHADKDYRTNVDAMQNEEGVVFEEIRVNKEGRVHLRGTTWIAYSDEKSPILRGEKVIVDRVDGVKLKVRKKEKGGSK
jgi:membrane protein implicated in regulation of membrane protease activity